MNLNHDSGLQGDGKLGHKTSETKTQIKKQTKNLVYAYNSRAGLPGKVITETQHCDILNVILYRRLDVF